MAKEQKEQKAVVQRQPNAIQRYFGETVGELRKVSWPTRQEAFSLTVVVLGVMIGTSVMLGVLDVIFARLFALLLAS